MAERSTPGSMAACAGRGTPAVPAMTAAAMSRMTTRSRTRSGLTDGPPARLYHVATPTAAGSTGAAQPRLTRLRLGAGDAQNARQHAVQHVRVSASATF